MRPLEKSLIKRLNLESVVGEEAGAWRNLLPPEPWIDQVKSKPEAVARWVSMRLEAGIVNQPGVVVHVRKSGQAFRPVPVVGIAERIALRALTQFLLRNVDLPSRAREDYVAFVSGPLLEVFKSQQVLKSSDFASAYIVQSDISSYYDYIDHQILHDEIELRTFDVATSRHLLELLGEVQGREFGLPQLLDSSDLLSELYIGIIHRNLVRLGLSVWHYNDDFLLLCRGYDQAQEAVERLSSNAHAVGLTLNTSKTHISKLLTYILKHGGGGVINSEGDIEFKPDEVEVLDSYWELELGDQASRAEATFSRLLPSDGEEAEWDCRELKPEHITALRRALGFATANPSLLKVPPIEVVFEFVAELSHSVCRYLIAAHEANIDISSVWDDLTSKVGVFNHWQRLWLIHVGRHCGLFSVESRLAWLEEEYRISAQSSLHRAEAVLALAPSGRISADDLDSALRTEPDALTPWYAMAVVEVPGVPKERVKAIRRSSALFAIIIDEP